jgi:hypothetical protein
MKVFDMDNSDDDQPQIASSVIKKRDQKGAEKGSGEGKSFSRKLKGEGGPKVNRLVSTYIL